VSGGAWAQSFTPADAARLARGETVERPQRLELRSKRYVGGVTYTVIEASAAQLDSVLASVATYPHFLPYTKDARLVGRMQGDLEVWLRQGNALLDASYTIRVHPDPAGGESAPHVVRFWLERSRPHGIEDASGYFRYEPLAPEPSGKRRLLLTFGIWVNIGSGMVRAFFEGRIQQIALSVPQRLRAYLADRARAGAVAPVR
jgi:hypothetical protein